jgi:hypothetical protein
MFRKRTLVVATLLLAVVLVLAGGGFFSGSVSTAYASAESGFEYDVPVLVWRALPQVFPEYMPGPGGYLSFGVDWVRGEQLPVGLAMTDGTIPRIRPADPSSPGPRGVDGARPDLEGYRAFLVKAAKDPRFNADNIMPFIVYNERLSLRQRWLYRNRIIPQTREALLQLETR